YEEVEGMNPQFLSVPKPTGAMALASVIGVGVLLLISVILGIIGKRQWKSYDEYLVGHRDIGPVVTGLALSASYLSGWAFCGSTGVVYSVGFSGMWFAGIWSIVGIIPCIWLASVKTREFSSKLKAATLPETIGRRFESPMLQAVIGICMLFFLFMYSVGQLKAAGGVWYAVTGLPPLWCLLLSIFIAWLYMVLGGYVGTQWSMAFQGALLGIVGALVGVWALVYAGGFHEISARLWAENPKLIALIRPDLPQLGSTQLFSSLVGILATPVIFFTMAVGFPHNVSRFLGMKKMTKKEYFWMVFTVWLIAGFPIMLDCSSNGLIARMIYGPQLLKIEPWKGDLAAPMLSHAIGGTPLMVLYVMGLFAAALSTLAAMVFIMSANVTRDVVKLWWPQVSDKGLLKLSHFLVALFLFLPFYWTLKRPPELLAIFMGMAAMGLGAIFFFVTAISYYWKRATKWGALVTVIFGTAMTLYGSWAVLFKKTLGMGTMEWILVIGCFILYFGVSLLTRPPSEATLNLLFPEKK
ncbi:MAG TPA: sodium:solute symporter family protein, partial [Candidatus Methylomirabilis sp.]